MSTPIYKKTIKLNGERTCAIKTIEFDQMGKPIIRELSRFWLHDNQSIMVSFD